MLKILLHLVQAAEAGKKDVSGVASYRQLNNVSTYCVGIFAHVVDGTSIVVVIISAT